MPTWLPTSIAIPYHPEFFPRLFISAFGTHQRAFLWSIYPCRHSIPPVLPHRDRPYNWFQTAQPSHHQVNNQGNMTTNTSLLIGLVPLVYHSHQTTKFQMIHVGYLDHL